MNKLWTLCWLLLALASSLSGGEIFPHHIYTTEVQTLQCQVWRGGESVAMPYPIARLASGDEEIVVSFDLADPEASVRSTEEYMIADGTTWSSRMTGSGTVVSDSMALDVTLPDGRELSIPFKPSSPGIWLGGLRLLRCGGGEYDVYVVEIAQDEEYLIHTAEYILRVDEQGTPLGVYAGEEADQFYSARSDGGALYTMGVDETSVTVKRAPDVYTTAWADYVSPLADITLLEE